MKRCDKDGSGSASMEPWGWEMVAAGDEIATLFHLQEDEKMWWANCYFWMSRL